MNRSQAIEKFNEAISLELCGLLQYNQYAHVVMGVDRRVWRGFFLEKSDESLVHARKFSEKVTALGGVPSVVPEQVHPASDLHEMLVASLEHERRAVDLYSQALKICEDNTACRNMLEQQIEDETQDVEELEKFLNQVVEASSNPLGRGDWTV